MPTNSRTPVVESRVHTSASGPGNPGSSSPVPSTPNSASTSSSSQEKQPVPISQAYPVTNVASGSGSRKSTGGGTGYRSEKSPANTESNGTASTAGAAAAAAAENHNNSGVSDSTSNSDDGISAEDELEQLYTNADFGNPKSLIRIDTACQEYYDTTLNTVEWRTSTLNVQPGDHYFVFWFLLSSYFPLICGCIGPLSNMFSLFAIVCSWKVPKNVSSKDHIFQGNDEYWVYTVNGVSVGVALVSNFMLLLNFRKKVRYVVSQVISVSGWFVASMMLMILVIVYHAKFYKDGLNEKYELTYGFYFACITVCMHFSNFFLLFLNELGFLLKKYKPVFNVNGVQKSLMFQSSALAAWLIIGAAMCMKLFDCSFGFALYYCTISIVTVGEQQDIPDNPTAQGLTSFWIMVGLVIFGLIVSSIVETLIDFSSSTLYWHRLKLMRNVRLKIKRDEIVSNEDAYDFMRNIDQMADLSQKLISLVIILAIFMLVFLCGGAGLAACEGWNFSLGVYFCFCCLVTLGCGNVVPATDGGRAIFCVWALASIPTMSTLISNLSSLVFSRLKKINEIDVYDVFYNMARGNKHLKLIAKIFSSKKDSIDIEELENLMDDTAMAVSGGMRRSIQPTKVVINGADELEIGNNNGNEDEDDDDDEDNRSESEIENTDSEDEMIRRFNRDENMAQVGAENISADDLANDDDDDEEPDANAIWDDSDLELDGGIPLSGHLGRKRENQRLKEKRLRERARSPHSLKGEINHRKKNAINAISAIKSHASATSPEREHKPGAGASGADDVLSGAFSDEQTSQDTDSSQVVMTVDEVKANQSLSEAVYATVPLPTHPVDTIFEFIINNDKLSSLEFVNSPQFVDRLTMSCHLANYSREGAKVISYSDKQIRTARRHLVSALRAIDGEFNIQAFLYNYQLEIGPDTKHPLLNEQPWDQLQYHRSVLEMPDYKIHTMFHKKHDFVLNNMCTFQILLSELKKALLLMCFKPDFKYDFSDWDRFLRLTQNSDYLQDNEQGNFWLGDRSPLCYPNYEPQVFALAYLRHLESKIHRFSWEYDKPKYHLYIDRNSTQ